MRQGSNNGTAVRKGVTIETGAQGGSAPREHAPSEHAPSEHAPPKHIPSKHIPSKHIPSKHIPFQAAKSSQAAHTPKSPHAAQPPSRRSPATHHPGRKARFLSREIYRQTFRHVLPLAISGGFLLVLLRQLGDLDTQTVFALTRAVTPLQWILAILLTTLSFLAVGRYDAVVHRMLNTGVTSRRAGRAGIAAIALSQTTGFGLFVGALARWRMLPEISLWQATRLTAVVAISFLSGWVVVAALVLAVFPGARDIAGPSSTPILLAGMALALCACLASLFQPLHLTFPARLRRLCPVLPRAFAMPAMPPLSAIAAIFTLTLVDTFAACGALHVLMPPGAGPGFTLLLPAFLLAFGAGMILGAPAGVGPFEVALFAMLPFLDAAPLMAAVLAWRLVYYIVPALLGALALARGQRDILPDTGGILTPVTTHAERAALIAGAPFAEAGLAHQGRLALTRTPPQNVAMLTGETGQCLVALRTPFAGVGAGKGTGAGTATGVLNPQTALHSLIRTARQKGKHPCLYKCTAPLAAAARQRGWQVMRIAEEATIPPGAFDLMHPARKGLRRKLRKAEKSGIQITPARPDDGPELAAVAREWRARNGGERGWSMGQFCMGYLRHQRVFVARRGADIIAFASFHEGPREWGLDLMRQSGRAPDGTMQALVVAAINAAQKAGVPCVSLAAQPLARPPSTKNAPMTNVARAPWRMRLTQAAAARLQGTGLRQFKTSFAPDITPLYIAAPGWGSLALAGFDILQAIRAPLLRDDAQPGYRNSTQKPQIRPGFSGAAAITARVRARAANVSANVPADFSAAATARPPGQPGQT